MTRIYDDLAELTNGTQSQLYAYLLKLDTNSRSITGCPADAAFTQTLGCFPGAMLCWPRLGCSGKGNCGLGTSILEAG